MRVLNIYLSIYIYIYIYEKSILHALVAISTCVSHDVGRI
jgi:hypothetical protein